MKPKKKSNVLPAAPIVTLQLTNLEVGQVLEGLDQRLEAWRNTAEFYRTGVLPTEWFVAEECNGEHEAQAIADIYASIIRKIESQREAQRL